VSATVFRLASMVPPFLNKARSEELRFRVGTQRARHRGCQSLGKRTLVVWITGLYQAVAVEEDAAFLSENGFYFLIAHLGHKPQGHPPDSQFLNLVTTMPQVGQVVTRIGVAQGTALGVEDGRSRSLLRIKYVHST
jgi:hypothetical protein